MRASLKSDKWLAGIDSRAIQGDESGEFVGGDVDDDRASAGAGDDVGEY